MHPSHLEGLFKCIVQDLTPEFLILQGWDGTPNLNVSNKFPHRADSAGVGSTLDKETTALKYSLFPEAPFWAHEEYHYLLHHLGRQWGWK